MDYEFVQDPNNMKWVFNFKSKTYVKKPDIKLVKKQKLEKVE